MHVQSLALKGIDIRRYSLLCTRYKVNESIDLISSMCILASPTAGLEYGTALIVPGMAVENMNIATSVGNKDALPVKKSISTNEPGILKKETVANVSRCGAMMC
jgi:hypothetical protein